MDNSEKAFASHLVDPIYLDHTARDSINQQTISLVLIHPFTLQIKFKLLFFPGRSLYLIICSGQCLVPDRQMDLRTCLASI